MLERNAAIEVACLFVLHTLVMRQN